MNFRVFKIAVLCASFIFLTGFLPIMSLLAPGFTVASSGSLYKAGIQYIVNDGIKKKTGKNSFSYVKEEVKKQTTRKNFNEELRQLVEKRIKIVREKLDLSNINQ
jgi:hypothetical protein